MNLVNLLPSSEASWTIDTDGEADRPLCLVFTTCGGRDGPANGSASTLLEAVEGGEGYFRSLMSGILDLRETLVDDRGEGPKVFASHPFLVTLSSDSLLDPSPFKGML